MPFFNKTAAAALVATLVASSGSMAQNYYANDAACRRYADQQVAPMRQQAAAQGVGSALVGAGLGAALGAAVGGGRGAGIGAASGAIVGTGAGVANAQNTDAYASQQFNAYYSQCMSARQGPPPPQPGYAPAYSQPNASQLNQQQLYQQQPQPYGYPPQPYGYGYPR